MGRSRSGAAAAWAALVATAAALLAPLAALAAEPALEIGWDDLLPKEQAPFDDPFLNLSEDQLLDLGMVARIRFLLESEKVSPDGADAAEERRLVERLVAQGIDVDYLLSQRERVAEERRKRAETVDAGIDGQRVRIPGYLLALQREGKLVTEFLLVPWVGACIHTPPPPPNQMVHVEVPGGTEDRGRFAPVWVEGAIELRPNTYELFLVDGSREINVAYSMATAAVTEYSPSESDPLSEVEVPEEALAGHSWWQRWQSRVSLLFTKTMTAIKNRESSGPLLIGLLVAFLYGVVHTLGPGHGKAVVAAYFVGEGGSLWRGLKMGGQIAVVHVLSAVVVVVATDFAVRQATGSAPSDYRAVRLASYASIVVVGLWMLGSALRAARRAGKAAESHDHHEGCGCGHETGHGNGIGGFLAVAVGAVPCTGALLVLLFGLANDLLWPSVLLVIAISLGMAVALSAVGVAAILGRRFVDRKAGANAGRGRWVAAVLRVGGACAVIAIGCALFAFTWSGSGFPVTAAGG